MVVLVQKVGTLCIEYHPTETMSALSDEDGIIDEDSCVLFVVTTKFFPGYVSLLPIYALDARSYSQLRIKCYSAFDALDFISHLDLQEFEFKFIPSKLDSSFSRRDEFEINAIHLQGALTNGWTMRIDVDQEEEPILLSSGGGNKATERV
ncbi:MAG: hypothetical protein EOO53_14105 [Gammaproteobacteria bacterium]|nr:MAG: hypothetical protein EOO53_14105 [Gammaproteobacteria bacterium]